MAPDQPHVNATPGETRAATERARQKEQGDATPALHRGAKQAFPAGIPMRWHRETVEALGQLIHQRAWHAPDEPPGMATGEVARKEALMVLR